MRIQCICDLIPQCDTLIDVGCDHGKISKWVLDNNIARKVIASDISAASLSKARQSLAGYIDRAECRLGDGLNVLSPSEQVDVAVICGVGGDTISNILSGSSYLVKTLVLSPHTRCDKVYEVLNKLGYKIISQSNAIQKKHKYLIIVAMIDS